MNKRLLKEYRKSLLTAGLMLSAVAGNAQSFVGNKVLFAAQDVSVDITTHSVGDSMKIVITGPSTVWHAVGFGGNAMNGTYCIVVDGQGNVSERKLGNHNGGTQLSSSITSSNTSVAAGTRTTVVKRPLSGASGNHFTFPGNGSSVSVIWAYGTGSSLNSHINRGASLLTFGPVSTVSIAENVLQQAMLYPNPAGQRVSVDLAAVNEAGKIYLKDMSGRVLGERTFEAQELVNWDLNQGAGMYIIELQSVSGESASFKLMIQ